MTRERKSDIRFIGYLVSRGLLTIGVVGLFYLMYVGLWLIIG